MRQTEASCRHGKFHFLYFFLACLILFLFLLLNFSFNLSFFIPLFLSPSPLFSRYFFFCSFFFPFLGKRCPRKNRKKNQRYLLPSKQSRRDLLRLLFTLISTSRRSHFRVCEFASLNAQYSCAYDREYYARNVHISLSFSRRVFEEPVFNARIAGQAIRLCGDEITTASQYVMHAVFTTNYTT